MTTAPVARTGRAEADWGVGEIPTPPVGAAIASVAGVVVVIAVVVALLGSPLVGGAVGIAMLLVLGTALATRGGSVLRDADARPLGASEAPRLTNVAKGLSADLGMDVPTLWLVSSGGPNAFVTTKGGSHIGVTQSLVEEFTRTEFEATIAHCLVRLRSGEARASVLATAFGPLLARRAPLGKEVDVSAAAVTRYPPALASALSKAKPRTGGAARLWMVADDPSHQPVSDRIATLQDL